MKPVPDPVVPDFVAQFQKIDKYAEIEEIMKSPDFMQGGAPERKIFFEDTLIFAEGQRHLQLKRLFQDLMSRESMAYFEIKLLGPIIDETLNNLKRSHSTDGLINSDFVTLVQTILHKISAGVTGVDGVDTPERTARFRDLIASLGHATAGQFATGDKDEIIAQGKDVLQCLVDEFLQSSLDRRVELAKSFHGGQIAKEDLPRDALMTLCLKGDLYRPDDAERVPYVWRQASLFLTAAVQTTTHTIPHVLVHLDEWVKEHPEDKAKLTNAEFLHLAVGEALRLHQTSPVKFRIAAKDVTLSTGRNVAEGEMVALYAPAANLDPALFGPDSRYFNPYRERISGVQPWGLTFGAGRHMCLGRNLVIGLWGKGDEQFGTEGEMVRILSAFFAMGCELDPEHMPVANTASYHDTYESVPIILRVA
jgi:cytochrome P450